MDLLPLEARAKAAGDRNQLGGLIARGLVKRSPQPIKDEHRDFVADIQRRARAQAPQARINLAIRPKKKKRR